MKLKEAFAKKAYGRKRLTPGQSVKAKYGTVQHTYVVYDYHMDVEVYDQIDDSAYSEFFEKEMEAWPPYKDYPESQMDWGYGANNVITLTAQLPGVVTLDQFLKHVDTVVEDALDQIEDQRHQ